VAPPGTVSDRSQAAQGTQNREPSSRYFTVNFADAGAGDSDPAAGAVAVNVAKVSVKVPLREFFADAEMNIVLGVVTATEIGVVHVVLGIQDRRAGNRDRNPWQSS